MTASSSKRSGPPVSSVEPTGSSLRSYSPSAKKRGVKRPSASAMAVRRMSGRSLKTLIWLEWKSAEVSSRSSVASTVRVPSKTGFSEPAVHQTAGSSAGSGTPAARPSERSAASREAGATTEASTCTRKSRSRSCRKSIVARRASSSGERQPGDDAAAIAAAAAVSARTFRVREAFRRFEGRDGRRRLAWGMEKP